MSQTTQKLLKTVDNSMYVEDVLDSCETVEEAQRLRRQLPVAVSQVRLQCEKTVIE